MTVLASTGTFRHGVHPSESKESTEHLRLERMPFVDRYVLPLSQHLGAPCKAAVKTGDKVHRGQVIAKPGGFVSMTLHSPVTGRVVGVDLHRHPNGSLTECIEIAADLFSDQRLLQRPPINWRSLDITEFIAHVQQAGLVGLGGAAFPSHVKYKLPEGSRCERLVINGCECEPYLTADHRMMVEHPDAIAHGMEMLSTMLGADSTTVGIELNKPDGIEAMNTAIADHPTMSVAPLTVKYPQGAEKMLIKAIFGLEVPAGKLPLDLGIVVNNVATMAALDDYFARGKPLIERVVTVAGPGVARPSNLIVPIGTPVRAVLEHCGLDPQTQQVIMGGPMMGQPLASLDVPVLKGTSGLLAFTDDVVNHPTEYPCIRCGQCLDACGNTLNPSRLARLSRAGRLDLLEDSFVFDCMECGACSFVCPSKIPIVHLIRSAKAVLRDRKARET